MASDIDYDRFDYYSRQDYDQLEYQIDLFEYRYTCKTQKQSKRKMKNPPVLSRRKVLNRIQDYSE